VDIEVPGSVLLQGGVNPAHFTEEKGIFTTFEEGNKLSGGLDMLCLLQGPSGSTNRAK